MNGTKATHSPGPWKIHHGPSGNPKIFAADHGCVAEIYQNAAVRKYGGNGELIAAAPVMLDTLKTVLAFMGEFDPDSGPKATVLNHLEHAIRVAEGKDE